MKVRKDIYDWLRDDCDVFKDRLGASVAVDHRENLFRGPIYSFISSSHPHMQASYCIFVRLYKGFCIPKGDVLEGWLHDLK